MVAVLHRVRHDVRARRVCVAHIKGGAAVEKEGDKEAVAGALAVISAEGRPEGRVAAGVARIDIGTVPYKVHCRHKVAVLARHVQRRLTAAGGRVHLRWTVA